MEKVDKTDKRERILQSAMKLLITNGEQGTPMSAIAQEAGTGMGTIYNYFATKEELINGIYLYIKEDEIRSLLLPYDNESIKKGFDHFYRTLILYFIRNPLHFRFMDQFHNSPVLTQETREEGMKAMTPIINLIVKGQEQGIIKQIDFPEMFYFINGGLMGFMRWILAENRLLDQTLLDNQLRIAWDAVKQ